MRVTNAELAEYQAAQRHVNALTSAYWQSISVILGASLAGLFIVLFQAEGYEGAAILTGAAVGVTVVLELWRHIWRRHLATMEVVYLRMRQIERQAGMRKNIYLDVLRRWNDREGLAEWQILSPAERTLLADQRDQGLYGRYGGAGSANKLMDITARLVQVGWLAAAVAKWIQAAQ